MIKPESKTALDNIVKLTKEKGDWKFTIEGHTDSTATPAHNPDAVGKTLRIGEGLSDNGGRRYRAPKRARTGRNQDSQRQQYLDWSRAESSEGVGEELKGD